MSARGTLSQLEVALAFLTGLGITLMVAAGIFGVTFIHPSTESLSAAMFWLGFAAFVGGAVLWLYLVRPWTQFDDINKPKDTGHHHGAEHDSHDEDAAEAH